MPKCTWRDKPGADESCGLLADAAGKLCPRHAFLDKLRQDAALEKERAALVKRNLHQTGWPKSKQELIERGYQLTGSGECSGCGKHIEWWRTPNGRPAPYDPMPQLTSAANSHFATCTRANTFRKAS